MAQVVDANQNLVKTSGGQVVTAQQGGWYDGQQYWGGSLSNPGQINAKSNQQGAGQQVSNDVIAQTNPNNVAYIQQQQQQQGSANTNQGNPSFNPTGGGDGGAGGNGAGIGYTAPATIDLPKMYQNLYDQQGIGDLEKSIADKGQAYNDAKSKINDNPFLSEGDRTGRVEKLTMDYNNNVKNDQDALAMKKADIQTQMDLQTKQFDINSQVAQQSLQQFQTLLNAGALDNASGEDIANITKATGLSSNMILSAVKTQQQKNVQTSVIQFDDGTNQGYAVINSQTGQIINKQVIGSSKPKGTSASDAKLLDQQQNEANAANDVRSGATLQQLVNRYGVAGGLSVDELYSIYNSNTSRGVARESLNQAKQGVFANMKGFKTEAQLAAEKAKAKAVN